MQIKLIDVLNYQKVLENESKKAYPPKFSYAIGKNLGKLAAERKTILDQQIKIIEQRCEKDEEGKPILNENRTYKLTDEANAECNAEFAELLKTETDIDFMKVSYVDLDKCGEGRYETITGEEISLLDFMVE